MDSPSATAPQRQDRTLPLHPILVPQLHLQGLQQHIQQIRAKPDREHVQRRGRALAEVPLRRHLLREIVINLVFELVVVG